MQVGIAPISNRAPGSDRALSRLATKLGTHARFGGVIQKALTNAGFIGDRFLQIVVSRNCDQRQIRAGGKGLLCRQPVGRSFGRWRLVVSVQFHLRFKNVCNIHHYVSPKLLSRCSKQCCRKPNGGCQRMQARALEKGISQRLACHAACLEPNHCAGA
jgi:hypothetical protein